MAEELDLHLLELARAEREIARRDLVAETLADLGDAERNSHPGAVDDVLEIDEDPLGRLRAQEGRALFAAQGADIRLEHQVEFARLGQRAELSWRRDPSTLRQVVDLRQRRGTRRPTAAGPRPWPAGGRTSAPGARRRPAPGPSPPPSPRRSAAPWPPPTGRGPGRTDNGVSIRGSPPCGRGTGRNAPSTSRPADA